MVSEKSTRKSVQGQLVRLHAAQVQGNQYNGLPKVSWCGMHAAQGTGGFGATNTRVCPRSAGAACRWHKAADDSTKQAAKLQAEAAAAAGQSDAAQAAALQAKHLASRLEMTTAHLKAMPIAAQVYRLEHELHSLLLLLLLLLLFLLYCCCC